VFGQATVPKDKLLVFEAKMGWEPLCKFLGVPVQKVTYPRVNDTAEFQAHVDRINTAGMTMGVVGLGIPFLFTKPIHHSGRFALEDLDKDDADTEQQPTTHGTAVVHA